MSFGSTTVFVQKKVKSLKKKPISSLQGTQGKERSPKKRKIGGCTQLVEEEQEEWTKLICDLEKYRYKPPHYTRIFAFFSRIAVVLRAFVVHVRKQRIEFCGKTTDLFSRFRLESSDTSPSLLDQLELITKRNALIERVVGVIRVLCICGNFNFANLYSCLQERMRLALISLGSATHLILTILQTVTKLVYPNFFSVSKAPG